MFKATAWGQLFPKVDAATVSRALTDVYQAATPGAPSCEAPAPAVALFPLGSGGPGNGTGKDGSV